MNDCKNIELIETLALINDGRSNDIVSVDEQQISNLLLTLSNTLSNSTKASLSVTASSTNSGTPSISVNDGYRNNSIMLYKTLIGSNTNEHTSTSSNSTNTTTVVTATATTNSAYKGCHNKMDYVILHIYTCLFINMSIVLY